MQKLKEALDLFRIKYGRYPTDIEGLAALSCPPNGKAPLLDAVPDDPWGHPYIYTIDPGREGKGPSVRLASRGRDGILGTEDDIRR